MSNATVFSRRFKSLTDDDLKAIIVAYRERIDNNTDKSGWVVIDGERFLDAPTFRFEAEVFLEMAEEELFRRDARERVSRNLLDEAKAEQQRRNANG